MWQLWVELGCLRLKAHSAIAHGMPTDGILQALPDSRRKIWRTFSVLCFRENNESAIIACLINKYYS